MITQNLSGGEKNFFRREDGKIPMVMVKEGACRGFRRKGIPGGNTSDYSRGEKESYVE